MRSAAAAACAACVLALAGSAARAQPDPVDQVLMPPVDPDSAAAPAEPPPEPPVTLPAEPPLPDPAFATDPVATHPAGLDPVTLCAPGATCTPAPAAATTTAAPAGDTPLAASAFVTGALLGYHGHPTRTGGAELTAVVDLWRGDAWGAVLGYTVDSIQLGSVSARYSDAMLGGRVALPFARRTWLVGTAHVLSGNLGGGNGAAGFLAAGTTIGSGYAQLGLVGMTLDGGGGVTGSLRGGLTRGRYDGWLKLDAQDTSTGAHVSGAVGFTARAHGLTLDVEALLGDRAYTLIDGGTIAEPVSDTFHTTGRALLGYTLGSHVRPYLGVSARSATTTTTMPGTTTTTTTDYSLFSAFAGVSLSFN